MTRPTFTIAVVAFVCSTAAAAQQEVTCESPCECQGNHSEHRWSVKVDPSLPPIDVNAIQSVTPSAVYGWPGIDVHLTMQSERIGIENNWFALTGRVVVKRRLSARVSCYRAARARGRFQRV